MSNFKLLNPDCVLIHVPKTGGTTIRKGLWHANYDGPVFGFIPETWKGLFRFAFVRHPLDRFMSAYRDFCQNRGWKGGLDNFILVATNTAIDFRSPAFNIREDIRHHTIPQTHPYNCLQLADFTGRYETFEEDLADHVLERVNKPCPDKLPQMRKTNADMNSHVQRLNAKQLDVLIPFYAQDFEILRYDVPERTT